MWHCLRSQRRKQSSLRAKRSNPSIPGCGMDGGWSCLKGNLAASPTSPRLRGEVGLRSNPGEGVQVSRRSQLAERAPHAAPLRASSARLAPVKDGEREWSERPYHEET